MYREGICDNWKLLSGRMTADLIPLLREEYNIRIRRKDKVQTSNFRDLFLVCEAKTINIIPTPSIPPRSSCSLTIPHSVLPLLFPFPVYPSPPCDSCRTLRPPIFASARRETPISSSMPLPLTFYPLLRAVSMKPRGFKLDLVVFTCGRNETPPTLILTDRK